MKVMADIFETNWVTREALQKEILPHLGVPHNTTDLKLLTEQQMDIVFVDVRFQLGIVSLAFIQHRKRIEGRGLH